MKVIGVVADVKEDSFNFRAARPAWYLPSAQVSDVPGNAEPRGARNRRRRGHRVSGESRRSIG